MHRVDIAYIIFYVISLNKSISQTDVVGATFGFFTVLSVNYNMLGPCVKRSFLQSETIHSR